MYDTNLPYWIGAHGEQYGAPQFLSSEHDTLLSEKYKNGWH